MENLENKAEQPTNTHTPQVESGLYFVESTQNEQGQNIRLVQLGFAEVQPKYNFKEEKKAESSCGCNKKQHVRIDLAPIFEIIGVFVFIWVVCILIIEVVLPALFGVKKEA